MSDDTTVQAFWDRSKQAVVELPDAVPDAWAFGNSPSQADELLQLVLSGTKRATSSLFSDYRERGEKLPRTGSYQIILDGADTPTAVVQITSVDIFQFGAVPRHHAYLEGEGDRTLDSWKAAHSAFWNNPSDDTPIVTEQFRLIYDGSASVVPAGVTSG